jgi:UDP-N-acetylglucosamine--N-acetylmuramyl-(pentapeptide) pyrophosphoryl-undecaprenol N-acetylglucosamine transferase
LLGLSWPQDRPVLLVTGGSQGARRLNGAVAEALPTLINELGLGVVHLTGKKLFEETLVVLDMIDPALKTNPYYRVWPYSADMAALLGLADLALCRAGALSLSEMYVCGIPTILVPYPYAAADHQTQNAMASARAGASVMIEDARCNGDRLLQEIRPLIREPRKRQAMAEASSRLGHPDATARIVACLKQFMH